MYQHGIFAEIMGTKDFIPPKGVGTLPVYFGTAPVHQLSSYAGTINKPILVNSYNDAVKKVGYCDAWEDFTLCEAVYAHFKNNIKPIGPIVLINVLDPEKHKTTPKTASIPLINGNGTIANSKVILNSVAVTGKVKGTDYIASYTADGKGVIITALTAITSPVTVNFDEVNPTLVTDSVLIGGNTDGVRTGISAVDLVYPTFNMIPTLFCAPKFSCSQDVDAALKAASQKINGHWYAFVNSDLSTVTADTIEKAKVLKGTVAHTSYMEAPCWPKGKLGDKVFHLSTLTTVTMQWVDFENNNIPYETPSNKPIDINGLCLDATHEIIFDQIEANELNSKGIRTATYWGGRWILWGGHTGEYEYGKDMDKRNVFDCSVRMLQYIANTFQSRYGTLVDKPMSRARVDTILNDFNEWFDNLISQGAILLGMVEFNETSNSTSDIVEGDFTFEVATTTTPPGKSITAKISYTSKGINTLFGGGN